MGCRSARRVESKNHVACRRKGKDRNRVSSNAKIARLQQRSSMAETRTDATKATDYCSLTRIQGLEIVAWRMSSAAVV